MPRGMRDPTDEHVGSRVCMRRLMLSLSQEKLAGGLGLTFQQVQKYEKGTNRIGAGRLHEIARGLALKSPDITVSTVHSPSRSSHFRISVWRLRPETAFLIHFLISSVPRISVPSPLSIITASGAKSVQSPSS